MKTPTIEQVREYAAIVAKRAMPKYPHDEKALHIYRLPDGTPSYWRARVKTHAVIPEGEKDKQIRPFSWDGKQFVDKEPPAPPEGKLLYGLELLAMCPSAVVVVCEGENKADTINKHAMQGGKADAVVATTSGGKASARAANWAHLSGRHVVVFRDNDQSGLEYQADVVECLSGIAASVRVMDIAAFNLPHKGDAVDYFKAGGTIDALMLAIDAAKPVEQKTDRVGCATSDLNGTGEAEVLPQSFAPLPVVRITCAADIKPEPIRWLWDGWLARGKLHIFAGQAGTGKTTIAIALAATVSIGGRFPDGTRAPVGNVLIWSGEDSAQDTLVPRLLAADANLDRVHFISDVQHGDELRSFDPATDIRAMMDAATRIGDVALLLVDPVVNAVAGDSHKNGEVRRALQPLVDFGEKLGCAVLGISHFSKGTGGKEPLERVSGSLAFGALARIVLATAKINDGDTTKRIFCRAKSNIGVDHGGFEYDLHQKEIEGHKGLFSSYSAWGQAVEGSARELLAENEPDNDDGEAAGAEQFLRETLAGVAMPQKDIERECRGAGFSVATLRRAKKRLGVVSKKDGMTGGWYWSLPSENCEDAHEDVEDAQQNCVSTFGKNEHLRENSAATADVWEC